MEASDQLHDPAALSPRNDPPVPTWNEAEWAPKPAWTLWWRKSTRQDDW